MTYSSLKFCADVISLIDQKKTIDDIAKWANRIYFEHIRDFESGIGELLSDLSMMDTPGFEKTNNELLLLCIKLLQNWQSNIN